MNTANLTGQLAELGKVQAGFFTRNTEDQGIRAFRTHCEEVLTEIPNMDETVRKYPVYGAIGFLGKFEFKDCPEINDLITKGSSTEMLRAIMQADKALLLAPSARPAWEHLAKKDPETLCDIVAICLLASRQKKITRRL